jgi:hypothetical protein
MQNGDWNSASTWDNGIPAAADDVVISKTVTITNNVHANSIHITEGSLIAQAGMKSVKDAAGQNLSYQVLDVINVNVKHWRMDGIYIDNRIVDLRGVRLPYFPDLVPSISCIQPGGNGFLPTSVLEFPESPISKNEDQRNAYIMADPQPIRSVAKLDETANISATRNLSRWSSAGVRSQTVHVEWSKNSPYDYSEQLDRMVSQPFAVLLVSHTNILKGHRETKQPSQSGGEGYFACDLTIVEG